MTKAMEAMEEGSAERQSAEGGLAAIGKHHVAARGIMKAEKERLGAFMESTEAT